MESLSKLITALAALAWPVLIAYVIQRFHEPIRGFIESARGRKLTIEVAGQKLTIEEAAQQQRQIVSDLQLKVASFEKKSGPTHRALTQEESLSVLQNKRILWVDDRPKNNSYLVASLEERGIRVDIALTTDDGLQKFRDGKYDIVISDMGRPEDDKAGIDLAKKIRAISSEVPYFIYCGSWAAKNLRSEALAAGVTDISSSGSTLLSELLAL